MSDTPPADTTTGDEFVAPKDQEEFDRMVGARLARERAKFGDYDDLKAKASKLDEMEAAGRTELEQAQAAIAERDEKLRTLPAEARRQAIQFASLATQKRFLDPEDALVFIGDVDLADREAVSAALDELAQRKPHLLQPEDKTTAKPKPKPKPAKGEELEDGEQPEGTGKARAVEALKALRSTR